MGDKEKNVKVKQQGTLFQVKKEEHTDTPGGPLLRNTYRVERSEEESAYFERMLKNSMNENLRLKIKSLEADDKGELKTVSPGHVFTQRLPRAVKDSWWGSSENSRVKDAKKVFRNADLCTTRELASMRAYFKKQNDDRKKNGNDDRTGQYDKTALTEYVNYILNRQLTLSEFTDDYLSNHMAEMYEYSEKLLMYQRLKEKHPGFFDSLPAEKRAFLESRADMGRDLNELLNIHLYNHGVQVYIPEQRGKNAGNKAVTLRTEPADRTERHRKRASNSANFERRLSKFADKYLIGSGINVARHFANDDVFRSENALKSLEEDIASNEKARRACGPELDLAMAETKKALIFRDNLLAQQKTLLALYDAAGDDEAEKKRVRSEIIRNNKHIRLVSAHAEHYREFADFCLGKVQNLSSDTKNFIAKEQQSDLARLITFRDTADMLNEGLVVNERVKLKEAFSKKKDKTEKDEEELRIKLEAMTCKKLSTDKFYDLLINSGYREAKMRSDRIKSLKGKSEERIAAARKRIEMPARARDLKKTTDRIAGYLSDPHGKLENFDMMIMACSYKPGPDAEAEEYREVVDKGLMPLLKGILSLSPKQIAEMSLPENPDLESETYWKNRMLLQIGMDMTNFLEKLQNWKVNVTDEELSRLQAFGAIAQRLFGTYAVYDGLLTDPATILAQRSMVADRAQELFENVYTEEANDTEAKAFRRKYSKKNLGYKKRNLIDDTNIGSQGNELWEYGAANIRQLLVKQAMYGGGSDILQEYDRNLKDAEKNISKPLSDEMKEMKKAFPEYGEREAAFRLKLKKRKKFKDRLFKENQLILWKGAYPSNRGSGDLRSFKEFMRDADKDANNVYKPGAEENLSRNKKEFNDFISGDPVLKNAVLRRMGKEVAAIRLTPEMMTLDYIREHYEELYEDMRRLHGFANIYSEDPALYESDMFTEEERDAIRRNIAFGELYSSFCSCYGLFVNTLGIGFDGTVISPSPTAATEKEKIDSVRNSSLMWNDQVRRLIEDPEQGSRALSSKLEKYDRAFKERPEEVKKAMLLWAQAKSELNRVQWEPTDNILKVKALPEGPKKTKALAEVGKIKKEQQAVIKEAEKRLKLCEEIRDSVLGLTDKELSKEAKALYDSCAPYKPVHVEYIKYSWESGADEGKALEGRSGRQKENTEKAKQTEETNRKVQTEKPLDMQDAMKERQNAGEEPVGYDAGVELAVPYEQQDLHNCWCCAGAALFNNFVKNTDGAVNDPVDQYAIRAFCPSEAEMKSFEEVQAMGLDVSRQDYDFHVDDKKGFMGEGKTRVGNIYEAADFFLKKRKDLTVRRMTLNLPAIKAAMGAAEKTDEAEQRDIALYYEQKKAFMDQLEKVLKTGNPVAMLNGSEVHYFTITRIKGEAVTYWDSSGLKEVTKPVEELLSRGDKGNLIELTWLEKTKEPAELTGEFSNLRHSEEKGFELKQNDLENALNPMWKEGISVRNEDKARGIVRYAYIPLKKSAAPAEDVKKEQEVKSLEDWDASFEGEAGELIHKTDYSPEGTDLEEMPEVMEPFFELDTEMEESSEKDKSRDSILDESVFIRYEEKELPLEELKYKGDAQSENVFSGDEFIAISTKLIRLSGEETGERGLFSEPFKKEADEFVKNLNMFTAVSGEEKALLKEMGINEPVELLYIDGTPIKSFVESRYNYKGNDPRILGYYAALTAGDLKYPMTCLRPRLKNGSLDLVAENIAIDFDTMDPKNSELMDARQAVREEQKNKLRMEYLKAGIEAQGELVKDPPSLFIEKAGRAHRKLMNLECSGLTAVEGLADRVRALRGKDIGPDQRFHTFLREFTGYYTYVEKFAVSPQSVPITQAGASRLVAMLELALSPLRSYIKGKDMKLARHAIAHDAYEILRKQKKILSNALENGVLSKEGSSVPITDLLGQAR